MTGPQFRAARIAAHYSYRVAARYLGVTVRTIQNWEARGKVPEKATRIQVAPCPTCGAGQP